MYFINHNVLVLHVFPIPGADPGRGGGAARNFLKGGGVAAHVYVFLILTIMCGYSANLLSIQLRAYIFKWLNYLSLHNNKCCFCLLFSVLVIILTFQLSHVYFFLGIDRHST